MKDNDSLLTLRFIRITGILGLIASLANGIGDIFYQAVPDGAYSATMEFMWRVPDNHQRFGAYFGLFAIALVLAGYWHIYQGIRKAGRWLALPPILLGMYMVPIGCALHFGLYYPALVGHQIIGNSSDVTQSLALLHTAMINANANLFNVYQIGVAIFSLWLMVIVFMGKTSYPRWFGILNPLFLTIAYYLLIPHIPKYGTYLYPAAALSDAVFFTLSTILLWRIET